MATANRQTETIGERLRRLRLERGLSQRELSGPGVSYAYISRIEAGARRPSVKALRVLGRKLGVSAEYLETGSEIHESEQRELRLAEAELRLRLDRDVAPAATELEAILAEAVASGDVPSATRARLGLGLAAAESGDQLRAAELLEQAIESGAVSPASRPDVFGTLGHAWSSLGQPERAVALLERSLEQVADEKPYDEAVAMRFASFLSSALTDLGDYDRAQEVLRAAVRSSDQLVDPYARVRLYWSLGRVSGNSGRPRVSLNYFRRAVALLEATEDSLHLARAHVSCAWMLISSGELDEAEVQLERAEQLYGASPAPADLVVLRRHQAELAFGRDDLETAVSRSREAIDIAGEAYPGDRGGAWCVLAEAMAAQGAIPDAERAFSEAAQLLDRHGSPRERAECYRAWGRLLRATGREAEALDVLERAADFAVEVRARRPAAER